MRARSGLSNRPPPRAEPPHLLTSSDICMRVFGVKHGGVAFCRVAVSHSTKPCLSPKSP
jgi:hypothetical protein